MTLKTKSPKWWFPPVAGDRAPISSSPWVGSQRWPGRGSHLLRGLAAQQQSPGALLSFDRPSLRPRGQPRFQVDWRGRNWWERDKISRWLCRLLEAIQDWCRRWWRTCGWRWRQASSTHPRRSPRGRLRVLQTRRGMREPKLWRRPWEGLVGLWGRSAVAISKSEASLGEPAWENQAIGSWERRKRWRERVSLSTLGCSRDRHQCTMG